MVVRENDPDEERSLLEEQADFMYEQNEFFLHRIRLYLLGTGNVVLRDLDADQINDVHSVFLMGHAYEQGHEFRDKNKGLRANMEDAMETILRVGM